MPQRLRIFVSSPGDVPDERLRALCQKYGADTVKAVMRRTMNDAEARLRAKLLELPDGSWTSVAHQDSARSGDRGIYKIVLKLTKDLAEPHAQECIEFAQAVAEGAPSPVRAEQSLQVTRILEAIYRSTQIGGEVCLD